MSVVVWNERDDFVGHNYTEIRHNLLPKIKKLKAIEDWNEVRKGLINKRRKARTVYDEDEYTSAAMQQRIKENKKKRTIIDLTEDEPAEPVAPILLQQIPTVVEPNHFVSASSLGSSSSTSYSAALVAQMTAAPRRRLPPSPAPMVLGGPTKEELDKLWITSELERIRDHLEEEFTAPDLIIDPFPIIMESFGEQIVQFKDARNYPNDNVECFKLIITARARDRSGEIDVDHLKFPNQKNCKYSGPELLDKLKKVADKLKNVDLLIGCDASSVEIHGVRLNLYDLQDLFYGQTFYNRQGFYSKDFDRNYIENDKWRSETKLKDILKGWQVWTDCQRLLGYYNVSKDTTIKQFGQAIRKQFGDKIQNTMSKDEVMMLERIMTNDHRVMFRLGALKEANHLLYIKNKIIPPL